VRENHTLNQIRHGHATFGLWLTSHSVHLARIIAMQGGFDWLLVDMEHSPLDLSTASMMLSGIADVSGGQCTPLARVAHGSIDQIKQALDAGAHGIIVPMVNTAEDAASVVRFSRYPPQGERGAGGLLPHFSFGTVSHIEYLREANDRILVAIQIETAQAVENVESILDVPGIDMVFVGPFDLHLSLGLPPALWSDQPAFQTAVQKVKAACQRRGIPYGTIAPNAESAKTRANDGFTFVGVGTDTGHLVSTLNTQLDVIRRKPTDT